MNKIETKICTQCGDEFPSTLEYFHKRNDKLSSWCKICRNEAHRKYSKTNKEKLTVKSK